MKPADFHTDTWARLKELLKHDLAKQRESLESPALTEVRTAIVRGRISVLKSLLALENPDPAHRDAAADSAYVD